LIEPGLGCLKSISERMDKISLNVNGKQVEVESLPSTPLLYILRNQLQLNGPKYGCGIGRCGSCMVLINGEARYSCLQAVQSSRDGLIQTLEALNTEDNSLHPIQQAFYEMQAAQCGYCINGMVLACKALLDKNPMPSEAQIKEALQVVLCRCGSHARIIKAIKLAAQKISEL
jgi:nicotinate dehydrogenase subunit A